jgi:hypothetical protein
MSEPDPLVCRISVTYVKPGPDGEREMHIIGLTSKRNKKYIKPWRLYEMLRVVRLCCEDVLTQRPTSVENNGSSGSSENYEVDDGQRTVTTTESDSASHE